MAYLKRRVESSSCWKRPFISPRYSDFNCTLLVFRRVLSLKRKNTLHLLHLMRNALFPRLFLASPAVPTGARHGRSGATRSKHMSMLLSNDLSQRRPTSPSPEHILPQPPPMRWRQFKPVALCSAAYVSMTWYACLPPGN